ncbi:hypothetical protein FPOAC1_002114 [Fusarium poae]|uniref:hypothetical protein n=1 Tax=Fusarium poae TaxID=36050 RepID=UPI001CEA2AE4|nr:hypothetical protein FPOAC1_002114 [Fusarium poae]KAG8676117.1 hypothetical protein FPOAC1_002114 [Fusarium poae]
MMAVSYLLKNNQFQHSGNVTFPLRPGAKTACKAITEYDGCAIGGTAFKLEKNHTVGCPILAEDESPKPKPCNLDVKEVPSKTTDSASRVTGTESGNASDPTSTSGTQKTNGDDGGADSNSEAQGHSIADIGGLLTVFIAVSA